MFRLKPLSTYPSVYNKTLAQNPKLFPKDDDDSDDEKNDVEIDVEIDDEMDRDEMDYQRQSKY